MIRAAIFFFILAMISLELALNHPVGISPDWGKGFLAFFLGLSVISFLGAFGSGRETVP